MLTIHRSRAGRALALVLCAQIGPLACLPPELLEPVAGVPEYQTPALVPVPGGFVNTAGGNLLLSRLDLSIDTPLGPQAVSAVYNSVTERWLWSYEISYDGSTFVDATGAVHDLSGVADGDPVGGTIWERVDADTLQTKGGLAHHFAPDGSLDHVRWASLEHPRIVFAPTQISQCTGPAACAPILDISPGPGGRPAAITDARTGRVASFGYDAHGRLETAKSAEDVASGAPGTRYEYASISGLLVATTLSDGERVEYAYRPGWRIGTVVQVGEGDPTHVFEYYGKTNFDRYPTVHTHPLGGKTRYAFDGQRRLLRVERLASGEVSTFDWSGLRPSRVVDPAGVVSEFDHVEDRLAAWRRPSGDTVTYRYEPGGLDLDSPTSPAVKRIEDGLGLVEERGYDTERRPTTHSNGELEVTSRAYAGASVASLTALGVTLDFPVFGLHGHWLDAELYGEIVSKRTFDPVGNMTHPGRGVAGGGVLGRAYDANRRVASLQVAGSDDVAHVVGSDVITISRRADGQIRSVARPGGGDHEVLYDALGRAVVVRERVDGLWRAITVEYDAAGNQTARELANGMREEYEYDVYGRMTRQRALRDGVLEGEAEFSWSAGRLVARYDSIRGLTETYAYDGAGRLSSTAFGYGETIAREYDVRGRLTAEIFTVPGAGVVADVGYEYDLADRPVRLMDRLAGEVLVEDVITGGLPAYTDTANGLRRTYRYDAGRLLGAETRNAAGEVVETTLVSRAARLSPPRQVVSSSTTTALASSEEHYWLPVGMSLTNPDQKVGERLFGWNDGAGATAYAWDPLSNPAATAAGDAFSYNAEGNRLLSATLAATAETLSYDYDEAGFATSRGGVPITWTATGRLAGLGSDTLVWDLAGRLVELTVAGQTREFVRFGGRIESGITTLGSLDLGAVSIHPVSGERHYRHEDFRGNVSFVSDDAGAIVTHHRYHPYGVDATWGVDPDGRAFEGHAGFGPLVFMGARMLDPAIGRFLSPDPVFPLINAYAYTLGNPVGFQDRDGRQEGARTDARRSLVLGVITLAAGLAAAAVIIAGPTVAVITLAHHAGASGAAAAITTGVVLVAAGIDGLNAPAGDGGRVGPAPGPKPPSPEPPTIPRITLEVEEIVPPTCTPLGASDRVRSRGMVSMLLAVNALAAAAWVSHRRSQLRRRGEERRTQTWSR
jgi:RHS repeat-associated protein